MLSQDIRALAAALEESAQAGPVCPVLLAGEAASREERAMKPRELRFGDRVTIALDGQPAVAEVVTRNHQTSPATIGLRLPPASPRAVPRVIHVREDMIADCRVETVDLAHAVSLARAAVHGRTPSGMGVTMLIHELAAAVLALSGEEVVL